MRKELSIYLDASRVLAAVLVFINHAIGIIGADAKPTALLSIFNGIGQHGRGAVAIFFVLSGFVIKYISEKREDTFVKYGAARATRIYSVVIPVLICVILADAIGASFQPSMYFGKDYVSTIPLFVSVPVSLAFLGELWTNHIFVGSDEPFWSLSFEVWYYVIFAAYIFGKSWWRWPLVIGLLLVAGPKIVVFFPLWVLGAFCFTLVSKHKQSPTSPSPLLDLLKGFALLLIAPIVYIVTKRYLPDTGNMYDPFHLDWNSFANVLYYSSFGIGFAATILAVSIIGPYFARIFDLVKSPVRWLAGGTFTLYLLHQPLLICFKAVLFSVEDASRSTLAIVISFVCCFLVAEIGERRKHLWASAGKRLLGLGRAA